MYKDKNILEQFEALPVIEPSGEWGSQLMRKLNNSGKAKHTFSQNKSVIYAITVLLVFNMLVFSLKWVQNNRQKEKADMKNIAAELLIHTSSSGY